MPKGIAENPEEDRRKKARTPAQEAAWVKAVEAAKIAREARSLEAGNAPPSKYVKGPDDGASDQLLNMRHVFLNPAVYDKTHAQKSMRKLYNKRPEQFNSQLAALEREHQNRRTAAASTAAASADGPDVGAERVEQLINSLFEEFEAQEKERK